MNDVRYWHLADKPTAPTFVCFWINNGQGSRRTFLRRMLVGVAAVLLVYAAIHL